MHEAAAAGMGSGSASYVSVLVEWSVHGDQGDSAASGSPAAGGEGRDGDRRLFLIDGPSLVYRAFYALPESIATSTGEPTNAIFGFASMLVKIVTEYGVQPTVVAWDAGTSGRTEMFADYKATRRSRPDLLKMQWPAMEPLVEAFGYRNVKLDGYEADDVIASLAERARGAGLASMIVTGDRDVFQLIDPEGLVKVMATSRGITDTKIYDHQAVVDRYGIPPELIPDFYGLKGDTSDNIPGVPGIGDKTASELIQTYGSLEGVLGHIREVGGAKRKQNLLDHGEDARVSKRLATVQRDLEVGVDLGAEVSREPDRSRLREFFRRYELRDPLRRLEEALGEDEQVPGAAIATDTTEVNAACARARGCARGHRGVRRRRGAVRGRARHRGARGRAVRRGLAVALCGGSRGARGRRGRSGCASGGAQAGGGARWGLRGTAGDRRGVRGQAGDRPRRQGARRRAGPARPRHAARRLSARAGAARLPVRGAVRRARALAATPRIRWQATRRCWARSPLGSASRSQSASSSG